MKNPFKAAYLSIYEINMNYVFALQNVRLFIDQTVTAVLGLYLNVLTGQGLFMEGIEPVVTWILE